MCRNRKNKKIKMRLQLLLLLIPFALVKIAFAQDYIPAIVELNAGAKIPGRVAVPATFDVSKKITLVAEDGQIKYIPLKVVKEIKKTNGVVIYPVAQKPTPKVNNSTGAQIILKAGAVISGSLYANNVDFSKLEKVDFVDAEGNKRNIPMKAIAKIIDSQGNVVFPKEELSQAIKQEEEAPQNKTQISSYDVLVLKNGSKLNVNLKLNGQKPSDLTKLEFVDQENNQRSIPLAAIVEVIDVYGNTIYPSATTAIVKEEEAPKKPACDLDGEKLKGELLRTFQDRYTAIDKQIAAQSKDYKSASFDMEQKLKKELYALIADEVKVLAKVNTMVDAVIRVYVDDKGKFVKVEDEVISSSQLRYYTVLRDQDIYPKLKYLKYDVNETSIEFTNEYEKIYQQYSSRIEASACPQSEFEPILSDAKKQLANKEKNIAGTYTVYSIPIKFDFSKRFEKWTFYNDKLRAKQKNKFVEITSPEVKSQFNSLFTKRQKNGKYVVNATYYSALNEKSTVLVNSVKRKYKYMTHFGVSAFAHYRLPGSVFSPKFALGDVYTFNANVVFHRIGFFGGTMYNLDQSKVQKEGLYYLQNFPIYGEGGIYVGLSQWFFLKMGASYMKYTTGTYKNGLLIDAEKDLVKPGFIGGMALMFPFVNVEWGYNSSLNSFYFGGGLHVSLNK